MSVRFYKIFASVFLAHLIILSVVWVGFSAPNPRPPATFTYEGALPVENNGRVDENVWSQKDGSSEVVLDHAEASHLSHWIKLRESSKPITHL